MKSIYHICTVAAWNNALQEGQYEHASLREEGFIHCSTAQQVQGVLQRYFKGQRDLLCLEIEPGKLQSEVKWELAASIGEAFPHVYGPINVDAVAATQAVEEGG